MAKVYVTFRSDIDAVPSNSEWSTVQKRRFFNNWDVRKIFQDKANEIVEIGDFGDGNRFDYGAIEHYFEMPKTRTYRTFKVRNHPSAKGFDQHYVELGLGEKLIVIYQRSISSVFEERAEKFQPEPLTAQDFFFFVLYEVHEETVPDWGRALMKKQYPDESMVSGVKVSDDMFAVLSEKQIGSTGCDADEEPWTNEYVRLVSREGKFISIYSDGYMTWDGERILRIRLSRSGKSVVVTTYDEPEVVIPLAQYLK